MSELQGKAAVITGASRGIGKAAAEELARQSVAVTLAARSLGEVQTIAAEIEKAGGKAEAVACDVADYDQVTAALSRCRERFGSLDILINNAGLIEPIGRLADTDPADWRKAAEVNYLGVYHGLRAAIPVMIEQGGGVIVNVSSGAATSAMEGWSHYCSSKAAALSLTQCADLEYRDQGIRVLGLSPGTVATHMQVAIKASGINPVSKLNLSDHIPPEWAGRALAWLCTEDAAEFAGTDVRLRSEDIRRRIGLID
jgi:NAD(P)-dependent dehydrogenase (short-subunit alcohol dehydrogenase family)